MKAALQFILVVVVLAGGAAGFYFLYELRPQAVIAEPEPVVPIVRVLDVSPEDLQLVVETEGTVQPTAETVVVPEVSGRVVHVSPSLVAGGLVHGDEILIEIDARDYELAVVRARAAVAAEELRLAHVEADADVARREWEDLGNGDGSPLALREPQLAEAHAAVAAARAALEQAERDLERTLVRAPFTARVRSESVELGQFVARGNPVAQVYSIDDAEVRLPLSQEELGFLGSLGLDAVDGQPVILREASLGASWEGRLVRMEGEIDPRTRLAHVVARVEDPLGLDRPAGHAPLSIGLFVRAEILGRRLERVLVVPRAAMRGPDVVLVVDAESVLRFRQVDVVRTERDRVILRGGLQPGDRPCLTPLSIALDGMPVKPIADDPESTPGEPS